VSETRAFSAAPARIAKLSMPGWRLRLGQSLRSAERELERARFDGQLLDPTYADTHRFPPPPWALETFKRAASGEGMTYTPYAGDADVRKSGRRQYRGDVRPERQAGERPPHARHSSRPLHCAVCHCRAGRRGHPRRSGISLKRENAALLRRPSYARAAASRPDRAREARFRGPRGRHEARSGSPHVLEPEQPDGRVHGEETIRTIAKLAQRYDIPVLVDQLYCRLLYGGATFHHLAAVEGMEDRTVTLLGPSKTESLSGYRVGVAVAPAHLVNRMENVLSISALRAPAYAQHILPRWLATQTTSQTTSPSASTSTTTCATWRFADSPRRS
jgi:hypothetical protein